MSECHKDSGFEHHESPPSSPLSGTSTKFTNRTGSNGCMTETTITAAESSWGLVHSTSSGNTPRNDTFRESVQAINNGQGEFVEGWPILAKLMTEKPDFEAFPRYVELNVKNLLYYQVELAKIQAGLERQEKIDGKLNEHMAPLREHQFHMAPSKMIDTKTDQWDQVQKLRKCLKEYNKALLQYSQVAALPSPSRRNMKELVQWIASSEAGNHKVQGYGSDAWNDLYADANAKPSLGRQFLELLLSIFWARSTPTSRSDLAAPRLTKSVDWMTRWIAEEFMPFWVNMTQNKKKDTMEDEENTKEPSVTQKDEKLKSGQLKDPRIDKIKSYSGLTFLRFTSALSTIFACLLPMAAIGILSTMEKLSDRLAIIAGFTVVFCAGVMILTDITRLQVFTATSTFLAVLVVFVQQGSCRGGV